MTEKRAFWHAVGRTQREARRRTFCDLAAAIGIGWSLFWLRHDAAVREAETGETGLFRNEVWTLAGVNAAVWIALQALWPG